MLAMAAAACVAGVARTTPARAEPQAGAAVVAPPPALYRVAAIGAERSLTDLTAYGAGLELAAGSLAPAAPHFVVRGLAGRTGAGLSLYEVAAGGTMETALFGHVRVGLGAGIATLTVMPATGASTIFSVGPEGILRAGWDFGVPAAPFVLLDAVVDVYAGSIVWGPTLAVGYAF